MFEHAGGSLDPPVRLRSKILENMLLLSNLPAAISTPFTQIKFATENAHNYFAKPYFMLVTVYIPFLIVLGLIGIPI